MFYLTSNKYSQQISNISVYGYLAVEHWHCGCLQAAVGDLERRGARQLVVDLSDNRGGLVSEAVEIARLFLPDGSTVVSTRSVHTTNVTRVEGSAPITVRALCPLAARFPVVFCCGQRRKPVA